MNSFVDLAKKTHIGSDETLKGDTFGGLVVCGCYTDQTQDFLAMGVKDSKLLTNEQIMQVAVSLLEKYPKHFSVVELMPKEYNALLLVQNQTSVLNTLHKKVALSLKEIFGDCPHLVDEFPGCAVGDVSETRAESISLAVAAASIVARYRGLLQFEELSKQAGFRLPMGSTHVASGLQALLAKKLDASLFVKLHFKNVKEAIRLAELG